MDLSNGIISFIDDLGVVQGLLFGVMLILLHSKKNKPTLFLGFFIILFALEPIPNILHDLEVLKKHPQLELLPVGFHFLAYPFLLIYIQKISILGDQKPSNWTLVLGFIEFIVAVIVFMLSYETKLQIKESPLAVLYFFSGFCYSIYIGYLILKEIHKNTKEVESQYTYLQSKTLSWSKLFTYSSIIFHVLILFNFFIESHIWYAWTSVFNVILIYWVSFKGITQENILALVWDKKKKGFTKHSIGSYQSDSEKEKEVPLNLTMGVTRSLMSKEETKHTFKIIEDYIASSKCYTNGRLTIIDVAEAINIHPKRISYAINTIKSLNFNNYINFFRVVLAKEILKSQKANNLSIEGVGLEAGFHSKTTFYSAFKKSVNMTPAQYKIS